MKRLDVDRGFSAAANEVLTSVEGAAFYLFLHDDVRLGPAAVTSLVAEAFRANGGIVGPKLLDWEHPGRLDSVGYSVDPYGFSFSISEPGELDQSQHDTAREVFAVSDACCSSAPTCSPRSAGSPRGSPTSARTSTSAGVCTPPPRPCLLCPPVGGAPPRRSSASVAFAEKRDRLELRHESRTMLANYELPRLLRVVPVVALLSLLDLIGSTLLGRFRRAGDIVGVVGLELLEAPVAGSGPVAGRGGVVVRTTSAYLPLMRQGSSRMRSLVRLDEGENRLQAAAQAGRGYFKDLAQESSTSASRLPSSPPC